MKSQKVTLQSVLFFSLLTSSVAVNGAANRQLDMPYDPNETYPFGRSNPSAPKELAQFEFLIGNNDCTEERLNNTSGEWEKGQRSWDAMYFMNGFGIVDSGGSSGSSNSNVRVYDSDKKQWSVTYFSMPQYSSGVWTGGLVDEKIVLKQPQKAPGTDFDGFSQLTFSKISTLGFDWLGEWVSVDGSVVFPFWRISCHKV